MTVKNSSLMEQIESKDGKRIPNHYLVLQVVGNLRFYIDIAYILHLLLL